MSNNPFEAKNKRVLRNEACKRTDAELDDLLAHVQGQRPATFFEELVSGTEEFLAYLGESPNEALMEVGNYMIETPGLIDAKKGLLDQGKARKVMADFRKRADQSINSPLEAARRAYLSFITAKRLKSENPSAAIECVARGAFFLALAVSADAKSARKKGARARLERNAAHKARPLAHALWIERHAGKHPELRRDEDFAAECTRRWPALTSIATVVGWCTEWNKEAKLKSEFAS